MKTYRQYIQSLIEEQEKIYDTAGGLRDHAAVNEKGRWNAIRTHAREVISVLWKLDNELSDSRASMKIGKKKEVGND
jgi:hypothetical protein